MSLPPTFAPPCSSCGALLPVSPPRKGYCSTCLAQRNRERERKRYQRRISTPEKREACLRKMHSRYLRRRGELKPREAMCVECGTKFFTTPKRGKPLTTCSEACSLDRRRRFARKRPRPLSAVPPTTAFKACEVCGSEFECLSVNLPHRRYCSKTCWNRMRSLNRKGKPYRVAIARRARVRRRARERDAFVEDIDPSEIAERDHWLCGLCGEPVERSEVVPHPLSATIDHIIPLAKGGLHEKKNVQLAHFWCNSIKGDKVDTPAAV